MEFAEKVRLYRRQAGLTQTELSKIIGVTQGLIVQYETKFGEINKNGNMKKTAKPKDFDTMQKLAKALGVKVTDLLNDNEYEQYQLEMIGDNKNVIIDKLDTLAGAGSEGIFDIDLLKSSQKITIDKSFLKGLNTKNLKLIEIVGDSMEPEYCEGDLAIVDMVNHRYDFIKISGIYIVRVGEIVYIKRVEFLPQGDIKLVSLNSKYSDMNPMKSGYDFEILGKVCGKIHFEIGKGLIFNNQDIS